MRWYQALVYLVFVYLVLVYLVLVYQLLLVRLIPVLVVAVRPPRSVSRDPRGWCGGRLKRESVGQRLVVKCFALACVSGEVPGRHLLVFV